MSSVYFDLYFRNSDEKSRLGSAWISAKDNYGVNNGIVTLSRDCGSFPELETVIKQMHADLDGILEHAKSKFAATS